jgi:hypothetical protein
VPELPPFSEGKMKTLLSLMLIFATVLSANAQTGEKKSETEIAIQKAMTELQQVPNDMRVLEESNKKLAISNQAQFDTRKMLDKLERKIREEDAPALTKQIEEFQAKMRRLLDSGCGADVTTDRELAMRCNAANDNARTERDKLMATQDNLNSQMQMINQTHQAVNTTTLENAAQQKKNNAALNDLQAKKLELYSQVIARSMSIVKNKAIASEACKTLTPLEKASCCLSVVSDGRNPAQCDVELIFKLFENAGAFRITEVRPISSGGPVPAGEGLVAPELKERSLDRVKRVGKEAPVREPQVKEKLKRMPKDGGSVGGSPAVEEITLGGKG